MKILSRIITVAFLSTAAWVSADIVPSDADWPLDYPSWWYHSADPAHGVIDATKPVLNQNNDAFLAIGQLKHIASQARDELDENFAVIGGAGHAIDTLVDAFSVIDPSNLSPANLGQLKQVSSHFFDRFAEVGFTPSSTGWPASLILDAGVGDSATNYPWLDNVTAENASPANIGQAKHLFSWDLLELLSGDEDADGQPDYFELLILNFQSKHVYDRNGVINSIDDILPYAPESTTGLSSVQWDFDGDGIDNLTEIQQGSDPTDFYNGQADSYSISLLNLTLPAGPAGSLAHPALNLAVRDPQGIPVANAPVHLKPEVLTALLSTDSTGVLLSESLTILTNANGIAEIYIQP